MLLVVLFFTFFSLFLYVLLGGADFGAGIVELFSSSQNKKTTRETAYKVMGPIWEANHIWLIILMVILWIAFPHYFNIVVVYLHVPLTIVLLGITMRGVAFIFRHYDAVIDRSQLYYNWMFRISSFLTPVFLGMSFAALIGGNIQLLENDPTAGFYEIFIRPWFNIFSLLVGLFFAALCGFMASTFLIGETQGEAKENFSQKSRIYTLLLVTTGFILLVYGYLEGLVFITDFVSEPLSVACVILSGLLLFPLWASLKRQNNLTSRILGGTQVALILFAAIFAHYPYIIITQSTELSLFEGIAPPQVIANLGYMLLIGGFVILPGLFHLMKTFSMMDRGEQREDQRKSQD